MYTTDTNQSATERLSCWLADNPEYGVMIGIANCGPFAMLIRSHPAKTWSFTATDYGSLDGALQAAMDSVGK